MWRESPVTIDLQFGWADARERLVQLTGTLEARIDAVCQRCLERCDVHLRQQVDLLLVPEETGVSSEQGVELWELDEDTVRPYDIVEELLIMALPMTAMHEPGSDCRAPVAEEVTAGTDRVRPFADLRVRIDETK